MWSSKARRVDPCLPFHPPVSSVREGERDDLWMREGKKRTERRKREKERNNYVGGKQHVDSGCLEVLRLWATFYISVTAFLFYIFTY